MKNLSINRGRHAHLISVLHAKSLYCFPSPSSWIYILSCYSRIPCLDLGTSISYCPALLAEPRTYIVSQIEIVQPCFVVLLETPTPLPYRIPSRYMYQAGLLHTSDSPAGNPGGCAPILLGSSTVPSTLILLQLEQGWFDPCPSVTLVRGLDIPVIHLDTHPCLVLHQIKRSVSYLI